MALSQLDILFRHCLHRRIGAAQFGGILKQYTLRANLTSREVVSAYLNSYLHFCVENDPLLPGYLQELLLSDLAHLVDFITALVLQWRSIHNSSNSDNQTKILSAHIRILTELNLVLATNLELDVKALKKCILLTARWLAAMSKWAASENWKGNNLAHDLTEVTGMLLVSELNYNTTQHASDIYNAVQQALDQCMDAFPSLSMQLMNRLGSLQKPSQNAENTLNLHEMDMAIIQFEEGILNVPFAATRSGTIALLYHLLSTGSTIGDPVVYAFLNTRHSGNHALMFNDLVFSTVDVLNKSVSNQALQGQCHVFMLNKLPSILSLIVASSYESLSSQQSLLDVWNYMNNATPDVVSIGKRLLHISTYHHLISSDTVMEIIEEDTSLKGLYAKDDLVGQVSASHARGPRLVDELLKNDGNVGTISQAIYEIMNDYCLMRETQHLKDMANAIIRKPSAINSIGMFIKPATFLTSLCGLLDNWKWNDIHGESQPVYDEFGSIFLLVLAFKERLGLTQSELGIQHRSFLAKYFSSENTEQKTLSESMQKHLGDWIKSLYIDEGLSDDLTRSCSAQEFYMLIPTLLQQSTDAHLRGNLSRDALKAGLEYLLEPFLLPSLVPAFGWMKHVDQKTTQLILPVLAKPPGGEAQEIHQTILSMAADDMHSDLLPQTQFALKPREGSSQEISTESCFILKREIQIHGPLHVVRTLISTLLQGEFHTLLDSAATMMIVNNLRKAVQVEHGKLGYYLKQGETLFAEALVHVSRRVELYANALVLQDNQVTVETFVPMNVANVNLDIAPETFQAPPEQTEDIDQVLNDAAAMGMDQLDSTNLDDIYGLQANDFGLGSLDDLDLDMDMF